MSEPPVRRQRLAAYALVLRGSEVLLTQLSATAPRPGAWTLPGGGLDHGAHPRAGGPREVDEATARRAGAGALPGGGLDHGEHPRDGVRREVYEETGMRVEPDRLLDVSSSHF